MRKKRNSGPKWWWSRRAEGCSGWRGSALQVDWFKLSTLVQTSTSNEQCELSDHYVEKKKKSDLIFLSVKPGSPTIYITAPPAPTQSVSHARDTGCNDVMRMRKSDSADSSNAGTLLNQSLASSTS